MYSNKIKCVCQIHQIIYYLTPKEKTEGGGCPFCYKKEIEKKKELISFCKENGIHVKEWVYYKNEKTNIVEFRKLGRQYITPWINESKKIYDNKSIISGSNKNIVLHHVKNYFDIFNEALENNGHDPSTGIIIIKNSADYKNIMDELLRLHYKYGAGVPLTKEEHIKFHSIYGTRNNTKEQLEEFIKKEKGDTHKDTTKSQN